jgi:antitoxin HigA-1
MKPITPGEILLEEYLNPLGLSQNALARGLGVSPRTVNEIVLGRRSITAEMSIRLGKFFSQSPRFWFGIQANCDFRKLRLKEKSLTARVIPLAAAI